MPEQLLPTPADIRAKFPGDYYAAFHAPRFSFLIKQLNMYLPDNDVKILDVGVSPFTRLLNENFQCELDILGFPGVRAPDCTNYIGFDLNDCFRKDLWPETQSYDVIVFTEVLEHLYTPPDIVFDFLSARLKPSGKLIVQTPNAAALLKRGKLLLGIHPYEQIRADRRNPGHFREYTMSELIHYARQSELNLIALHAMSYFDVSYRARGGKSEHLPPTLTSSAQNVILKGASAILPKSLRPGFTLVLSRSN